MCVCVFFGFHCEGIPSSHDLFSDHSLMDDEGTELFKWERSSLSGTHQARKKKSHSNNTFGPSAWSFDMVDGSEKKEEPDKVSEGLLVCMDGLYSLLFFTSCKIITNPLLILFKIVLFLLKNHAYLLR